jgi:hypothetical protein
VGLWTEVRLDLERALASGGNPELDRARRKYLAALADELEMPVAVYATDFLNPNKGRDQVATISEDDKDGWVEVTDTLPAGPLALMLHSPGGSPTAAEWIVSFLRHKFDPIVAIVPSMAKSAATMLALAADEILIDERGELGPTDPQFVLGGAYAGRRSPAHAILQQFEKARESLAREPREIVAWTPILREVGPSLLAEAENWITLSNTLVAQWLERYMFRSEADRHAKATGIAEWFGNHANFGTHSRPIMVDELIGRGLRVDDLRRAERKSCRDAVWRAWSAYEVTFNKTSALRIFENSVGDAYITNVEAVAINIAPQPSSPAQPAPSAQPPQPSRQQRRAQDRRGRR